MNMFTELAKKATTLSPIMEGRDKISVADIIATYPDGITINSIDMVNTTDNDGNPSTYPVFTFAEDVTKFGFGGAVFKKIAIDWIAAFEGDIDTCNATLKAQGGCKCKFANSRTKSGRNVTTVTPV